MNDRIEALLDELQDLVLTMHRSAADLDYIVMSIYDQDMLSEEDFNRYIQAAAELRVATKRDRFGNVERSETALWEEILGTIK